MDDDSSFVPAPFSTVLKQYIWGGRRLGEMLGKPIGADANYAESWEIVDRTPEQSVVSPVRMQGKRYVNSVKHWARNSPDKRSSQSASRS